MPLFLFFPSSIILGLLFEDGATLNAYIPPTAHHHSSKSSPTHHFDPLTHSLQSSPLQPYFPNFSQQLLQLGPDPNGEYWLNGTAYYSGPPPHENDAFQNAMLRAYKPEDQADDLNDILLFYPAMEPPGYNPCAGYALGSLQPPKNLY